MALRTILHDGDSVLRGIARNVDKIDKHIFTLLSDMADTMHAADGVGLAAPQIGVRRRVVVIDVGEGLIELINPEIMFYSGTQRHSEGCLSVPGVQGYVDRPEYVVVQALNRNGEMIKYDAHGYLAIAMCHEIDHLNGVLFTDKILQLSEEELERLKERDEKDMNETENI